MENYKHKLGVALATGAGYLATAGFAIDTDNLSNTGSELGGFLENMSGGLQTFLFAIGIVVGVLGIFWAISQLISKQVAGFKIGGSK